MKEVQGEGPQVQHPLSPRIEMLCVLTVAAGTLSPERQREIPWKCDLLCLVLGSLTQRDSCSYKDS